MGSEWEALRDLLNDAYGKIAKSNATNVNAAALRDCVTSAVQQYFRRTRPELESLGLGDDLGTADDSFQSLLTLSQGRNAKSSYVVQFRKLSRELKSIEGKREVAFGRRSAVPSGDTRSPSHTEQQIIATLKQLVPTAASSYEQALNDLREVGRLSYRGTANEMREALRDLLDYLAPDDDVMQEGNFKPEPGQTTPTMKQKVRYVMRSRRATSPALDTASAAVVILEETIASLTRHVSTRSSMSAHVVTGRDEVGHVKRYLDGVLCELLEIPG